MRVTIIPDDNFVVVNGHAETVDCSFVPEEIHAVHWFGEHGDIEYKLDLATGQRMHNSKFDNFTPFEQAISLWEVEAQKELEDPMAQFKRRE